MTQVKVIRTNLIVRTKYFSSKYQNNLFNVLENNNEILHFSLGNISFLVKITVEFSSRETDQHSAAIDYPFIYLQFVFETQASCIIEE